MLETKISIYVELVYLLPDIWTGAAFLLDISKVSDTGTLKADQEGSGRVAQPSSHYHTVRLHRTALH